MVHPSTVSSIYSVRFGGIYSAKAAAWCRYAAAAGTFFRRASVVGLALRAGRMERVGAGHCGQLLLPVLPGHGPAAHDAGKHTDVPARYFCRSSLCGAADSGAARLCGSGGQWIQQPDFPAGCQPGGLGAGAGGRVPDRSPALCPGGAGLSGPCDDADCDFTLFEL